MKFQAEIIHSYNRIKDDFDKVLHEETIFKTDLDPNDILEKDFDQERFINRKIKFKVERKLFEIDFPFKDYHDLYVDIYTNCEKRMKHSGKKLSKNEKLLQDYNNIFKEQLAQSIIEKFSEDESEKMNDITQS